MRYRYGINTGIQKLKTKTTLTISGLALGVAGLVMALGVSLGASAAPRTAPNLVGPNWRLLNITYLPNGSPNFMTDHPSTTSDGIAFQIPEGAATTSGVHTVYLETNWNKSLLETEAISVSAYWNTSSNYVTRASNNAFARVEFQDVSSGNYNANDYWWYHGTLNLNTSSGGSITASLAPSVDWTNICGESAIDAGPTDSTCVGGSIDNTVSPSEGFVNAMKNVKQVSLSFGSDSRYASGVANTDGSQTFTMTKFDIN